MAIPAGRWLLVCGGVALWLATAVSSVGVRAKGRLGTKHHAAARQSEDCGLWTGEFLLLYDLSMSYTNDVQTLLRLGQNLLRDIDAKFPGAKFAMATFIDKPDYMKKGQKDVCFQTHHAMTRNHTKFAESITRLHNQGSFGKGHKEAQMDGLYHGLMSPSVGWTEDTFDDEWRPILRVVMMATDAKYHPAGDGEAINPDAYHPHDRSPDPKCGENDFPSAALVAEAFEHRKATPLFLITGKDLYETYDKLLLEIGHGGTRQPLAEDSSNVIEAISHGLDTIACNTTMPVAGPRTGVIVGSALAGAAVLAGAIGTAAYLAMHNAVPAAIDLDVGGAAKDTEKDNEAYSAVTEAEFAANTKA